MKFLDEINKRIKVLEADEPIRDPRGLDPLQRSRPLVDPEGDIDTFTRYGPTDSAGQPAQTNPISSLELTDPSTGKSRRINIAAHSYKRIQYFIHRSYRMRNADEGGALLIYGDPGLGKSRVVWDTVNRIAAGQNRQLIDLDKVTDFEAIQAKPDDYFLFVDVRASQLQPFDLIGIPDIADKEKPYVRTKKFPWMWLFSLPNIAGVIFLDEIGHAHPDVQNSLFSLALDKKVGDIKISEDTFICAASNLADEFDLGSGSGAISQPLISRFRVAALVADPEEWVEYAWQNKVEPIIIGFVQHDVENNFYLKPDAVKDPGVPFPNPRSIFRFDREFKEIKREAAEEINSRGHTTTNVWQEVFDAAGLNCGPKWANSFQTYANHYRQINWDSYVENPTLIKKANQDQIIALQKKVVRVIEERTEQRFNEVVEVLQHLATENIPPFFTMLKLYDFDLYKEFKMWLIKGTFANDETAIKWRGFVEWHEDPDYGDSILARISNQMDTHDELYGV